MLRDENDVTLFRKYLTEGLVERLDMYTYRKKEVDGEDMWVVEDTDWRKVRDSLVDSMTNFGIPIIQVEDADYHRRGELMLRHLFDGKPLDLDYTERALGLHLYKLCSEATGLSATIIDDVESIITHDGETTVLLKRCR